MVKKTSLLIFYLLGLRRLWRCREVVEDCHLIYKYLVVIPLPSIRRGSRSSGSADRPYVDDCPLERPVHRRVQLSA